MAEMNTRKFNMNTYLRANLKAISEVGTIEVPAPPSWPKDENGDTVHLLIKPLEATEYDRLYDKHTKRVPVRDERGKIVMNQNGTPAMRSDVDAHRWIANGLVEILVDPDLHDPDLWKDLGAIGPVEAVDVLFPSRSDFEYMTNIFVDVHKAEEYDPAETVQQLKN